MARWNGGYANRTAKKAHAMFFTAGAEACIGYHLNKYFALEAVAGYQRYFKNGQLPVAVNQLNNFSAGITLVGTLGLTK
ncbi:hypothetical protein QMK33_15470 [Hymenobacter sp. H14-R3]|uniref:hypothetical protein n=1 Tax=Hymenobacter sp. H14-R3 TaxID=3046308 RepID=UPI0024BA0E58|nr:hypothetical protein [Hymenobacter sp. H14-R3]MDJ0366558.1 hypothetical protein [Hymenobacter sp. H14-R3]